MNTTTVKRVSVVNNIYIQQRRARPRRNISYPGGGPSCLHQTPRIRTRSPGYALGVAVDRDCGISLFLYLTHPRTRPTRAAREGFRTGTFPRGQHTRRTVGTPRPITLSRRPERLLPTLPRARKGDCNSIDDECSNRSSLFGTNNSVGRRVSSPGRCRRPTNQLERMKLLSVSIYHLPLITALQRSLQKSVSFNTNSIERIVRRSGLAA